MKTQVSLVASLISGTSAMIGMTLFTSLGGMMNIKMDIPGMLGNVLGGSVLLGWAMHFMIGVILAFNYAFIFDVNIKIGASWLKGMIFGVFPWFMAQIIVMPMTHIMNGMSYASGLFPGSLKMTFASLVGHLIYGVILGILYKPKPRLAAI